MLARRALIDPLIAVALAAMAWALYGPALGLWWTHDDVFILRNLVERRPFWYVFDVASYRELPAGLLTPLLYVSLDLDRRLFGLDPHRFYVHHLAAVSVAVALLYGVVRLWIARPWAIVAAWIFLVGPVTASLAAMLMVRQYVEAFVLAALATVFWALALRAKPGRRRWTLAALSAALYFAASLAKEIAVPLFVLLPLLPSPRAAAVGPRERIRLALPHAVAFAVYLGLRLAILGRLFDGYGFVVRLGDVPTLALELPGKLVEEFLGGRPSPAAMVFGAALVLGVAGLLVPPRGGRAVARLAVAMLLAALPVLPVSTRLEPRYAMAAWIVVAVAFALGSAKLAATDRWTARRIAAVVIALVACVSGLALNRTDWRVRFATLERMSAENRFVLEMRDGDVLRGPLTLAASLKELAWMRRVIFGRPPGGRWFQDDLFLCLHPGPLGRVWGYDTDARRIVDLTSRVPALRDRYCPSVRAEASLTASFRVVGPNLFWDLGPYRSGTYRFVLFDGGETFEMPRSTGFPMRGRGALTLRIGYESPDGWVTYSSPLRLELVDGWSLRWSRP